MKALLRHWWPAAVWAAVIWIFSTETFSTQTTGSFLIPLLHRIFPGASAETLVFYHFLIRKCAHVGEYFLFSLLVLRGVRGEERGWRLPCGLAALAVVACYAALDEVHQAFVPTRGASPRDVLLDLAGAVLAQVLAWGRSGNSPREAGGSQT